MHIKLQRSSGIARNESCSPPCQPGILSISLACYFPQRCRPNKTKCENISDRGIFNIRHCCILCVTRLYKSMRTKKSANILRVRFRPSLAIKDLRILVNDPEVTKSCNNGQLVPFLMHSYDYLEIIKDGRMVGKYCGIRAGQNILLSGDQILITFHSDDINQGRGFLIHFTAGPHGKKFS